MRLFAFALVLGLALQVHAQSRGSEPLSAQDQKALEDTQAMMRDSSQMEQYAAKNPAAKQANDQVKSLMGDSTSATYDLAADIFADMVKEAHGDPQKLQQLVLDAQKNPEAFAKRLSEAHKARLRGLANEVESRNGKAPAPH